MIDPIKLTETTGREVCIGGLRKYYRFRPARFYGGIATADVVGCCLRCLFCWSWNIVAHPKVHGEVHKPEDVAERLTGIARKKRFKQMRISGNEPTICPEHLINVLELIDEQYFFILETNGILIGADEEFARELARFRNLHVRVSLKGTNTEEFAKLTGALPEGFELQLRALENLLKNGVMCHPACMISFSPQENIQALKKRLRAIHPAFDDVEEEELILYPQVEERLKMLNIPFFTAHKPDNIPKEQR